MNEPPGRPSARVRAFGIACLLVTSVGWGLNWPAMKLLLREWPPLFARGTAGLVAAVVLLAVARSAGERIAVPRSSRRQVVASGFFNVFAWMGFSTLSLLWLDAGQGAMLVYTMPVWATLIAWPMRGRRPGVGAIVGVVVCLAGLVTLFGDAGTSLGRAQWPGVAFALMAATLFAFGTVALPPVPMPPFSRLAWQLLVGCVPMVAYGLVVERPDFRALTATGVAAMVYMTVFAMGVCYLAWFAALRRLAPAVASMGTLVTPVVGVASGALLLGEPFGVRQWCALALVVAGVALALREA